MADPNAPLQTFSRRTKKVDDVDPLFPLFRSSVSALGALPPLPRGKGAARGWGADQNAPSNALAGLPPLPPASHARKLGGRGSRAGSVASGRQRKARGGKGNDAGSDAAPRAPTAAELAEEALRNYFCSIEHVQLTNEEEDETEEEKQDASGRPVSTPLSRRRRDLAKAAKRAGTGGDAADSSSVATESGSDAEDAPGEDDAAASLPPPSAFKRGAWVASGVKARRRRGEWGEETAGGTEDLSKAIKDIGTLSLEGPIDEGEGIGKEAPGEADAGRSRDGIARATEIATLEPPPGIASDSSALADATPDDTAILDRPLTRRGPSSSSVRVAPHAMPSHSAQPPVGSSRRISRFSSRPSDFALPRLPTRPSDALPPPRFSSRSSDAPPAQLPSRRPSTSLTLAPPHPSDRLSLAAPLRSGRPSLAASRLSLVPLRELASRRSNGGKRSLAGRPSVAAAWIESVSKAIATEGGGLEAATNRAAPKADDEKRGSGTTQARENKKSVPGAVKTGDEKGGRECAEAGGEPGVEALVRGVAGLSVENSKSGANDLNFGTLREEGGGVSDEKSGDDRDAFLLAPTRSDSEAPKGPRGPSAVPPPPVRPQTRSRTRSQARVAQPGGGAARGNAVAPSPASATASSPAGPHPAPPTLRLPQTSGEALGVPGGRGGAKAAWLKTAEPSVSSPPSTPQDAPSPATRRSSRLAAGGAAAGPRSGVEDVEGEAARPLSSLASATPSPDARRSPRSAATTPPLPSRVSASLLASPDAADAGPTPSSRSPLSASPSGSSASSPGGSFLDTSPLAELLHICGQSDILSEVQGDLRSASPGGSPSSFVQACPSPPSVVATLAPHLPTMRDFLLACLGEGGGGGKRGGQGVESGTRGAKASSSGSRASEVPSGRRPAGGSPRVLPPVRKVGEGTFAEAFLCGRGVIKVMPIEGPGTYNDEPQRRAEDVLPEVAVHKALSSFGDGLHPRSLAPNATAGFVRTLAAGVCQGAYAPELLTAWTAWDELKGSENDDPSALGKAPVGGDGDGGAAARQGEPSSRRAKGGVEDAGDEGGAADSSSCVPQLYMVLVLSNGGVDLESADLERLAREGGALEASGTGSPAVGGRDAQRDKRTRATRTAHATDDASPPPVPLAFLAARSVLLQTTFTLAAAEQACEFEHRDLHWGNVLVASARRGEGDAEQEDRGEEEREVERSQSDGGGHDVGSSGKHQSAAFSATSSAPDASFLPSSPPPPRDLRFRLRGVDVVAPSCGVRVTLIDFTLSRLRGRGSSAAAFCDLGADPAIFEGPAGDPQADAYRRMRALVERDQSWDADAAETSSAEASPWARYRPATNAVWLAYLAKTLAAHKLPARDRAGKAALAAFARRAARAPDAARLAWDPLFEGCWKAQAAGEGEEGRGTRPPSAAERSTVSAVQLRA